MHLWRTSVLGGRLCVPGLDNVIHRVATDARSSPGAASRGGGRRGVRGGDSAWCLAERPKTIKARNWRLRVHLIDLKCDWDYSRETATALSASWSTRDRRAGGA